MDSSDRLNQPNTPDFLTANDIITIISDLYDSLSKAEPLIYPHTPLVQDDLTDGTQVTGNGRNNVAGDSKTGHKKSYSWSWLFAKSNSRSKKKKDGSARKKKGGNGGSVDIDNGESSGSRNDNSVNNISNHTGSKREDQGVSNESVNPRATGLVTSRSLPIINSQSSENNPFGKLCSDLHFMRSTFHKLKDFEHELGSQIRILGCYLRDIKDNMDKTPGYFPAEQVQSKIREFSKIVFNMKCQIPLQHKLSSTRYHLNFNIKNIFGEEKLKFPNLHLNDEFHGSLVFKEIKKIFENLEINHKLCLLCFAVFPDYAKIKKRLLMYWWIGERFIDVDPENGTTVEEIVKEILMDFTRKGLVVPVNKKRSPDPSTFQMRPIVRSAVISLANHNGFFEFDGDGIPTIRKSSHNKACLGESKNEASREEPENVEQLQTLFNVSGRFPDFTFKWFSKMKDCRVLYLGRWESTADRHIEVENTEYLKDLKKMKHLRFLSFQGISRIEELNDSICKLCNLTILDLRACYNLETLPDRIDLLKNLTHLDISECYLLDHMPKKISSLTKLQVLKGFVVSDVKKRSICTLDELSSALENLRKLSININREKFSFKELIDSIQKMKNLQTLKVAWGGGFKPSKPDSKEEGTGSKNKEKSVENKKPVANPVESTNRKGDDEIEEIDEGKPVVRNHDNNKPTEDAAKSVLKKVEKEEATQPDKKNKKKVEFIHEPGTNVTQDKGGGAGDIKNSESGATQTTARSLRRKFSLGLKAPKNDDALRIPLLPDKLEKLDLQCFPDEEPPIWLMPENLSHLKKLCIRGGNLSVLGEFPKGKNENCAVQVLRLKYLSELKMNWMELQAMFPSLVYLEKFRCPKITFCPCDGLGVWVKKNTRMIAVEPNNENL